MPHLLFLVAILFREPADPPNTHALTEPDFLPFKRSSVFSADSSFAASRPIHRAVLSGEAASLRAVSTAGACSEVERLPIWRSAQLTAFFTKLRWSVACRAISGRNCRNVESGSRLQ